jgi:hypothetical protein
MFEKLKLLVRRIFKGEQEKGYFLIAQLNDKVGPIDRGFVYEEPLDAFLKLNYYGEVTGGGTFQEETGEIACCDIEIELHSNDQERIVISKIIDQLEALGAPKGSKLLVETTGEEVLFGTKEGLALYLDGRNLPDEVYSESDTEFVWAELHRLIGIEPNADRNWQGREETAFYFYSDSFEQMRSAIHEFVSTYPLCAGARVVQIA